MNFTLADTFPADFIHLCLFYGLASLALATQLKWSDFKCLFSRQGELWWGLAAQHLITPVLISTVVFVMYLPLTISTGFVLLSAMPTLVLAALFAWLIGGNVALALLLVFLSCLVSIVQVPFSISLWSHWTPFALEQVRLVDYSYVPPLIVALGVVFIPCLLGMWLATLLPQFCEKWGPRLIKALLALSMLIPVGVIYSNFEVMKASVISAAVPATLIYAGSLYFVLTMGRALRVSSAGTVAFCCVTQNIAIAALFSVSGLDESYERILAIGWWGILQYYGGLLVALRMKKQLPGRY